MIDSILKSVIGPLLKPLVDKIPDVNERNRLAHEFETDLLKTVSGVVHAQIETNMTEAKHPSIFVAGWRPAVGWMCVLGIGYNFVLYPFLLWFVFAFGVDIADAPKLNIAELMAILTGMLGLSVNRTYEKQKGIARQTLKKADD